MCTSLSRHHHRHALTTWRLSDARLLAPVISHVSQLVEEAEGTSGRGGLLGHGRPSGGLDGRGEISVAAQESASSNRYGGTELRRMSRESNTTNATYGATSNAAADVAFNAVAPTYTLLIILTVGPPQDIKASLSDDILWVHLAANVELPLSYSISDFRRLHGS